MITKWSKDGNRCLSVEFDRFTLYNILRIKSSDSVKGVHSYIEKNVWVLGFKFTYIDVNYDNIVFVEIKPEDNYTSDENSKRVKVLKETLTSWINSAEYLKQRPPFNWNYYVRGNNEYVFFLTGPKEWFESNGLSCLIHPLREITFNTDEEVYFPKYNPHETNKVIKISNYDNDDLTD